MPIENLVVVASICLVYLEALAKVVELTGMLDVILSFFKFLLSIFKELPPEVQEETIRATVDAMKDVFGRYFDDTQGSQP